MIKEIMDALNNPNGIPEDVWLNILYVMGDHDACARSTSVFPVNGVYFLVDAQKERLKKIIPFMLGENTDEVPSFGKSSNDTKQLALPPHEEIELRCDKCKGPFNQATGHHFTATIVCCGICAGRFFAWQLKKYGNPILTTKQKSKLTKRQKKQKKREEQDRKRADKQRKELEMITGKPIAARSSDELDRLTNPYCER
jgi:hypothetical protein